MRNKKGIVLIILEALIYICSIVFYFVFLYAYRETLRNREIGFIVGPQNSLSVFEITAIYIAAIIILFIFFIIIIKIQRKNEIYGLFRLILKYISSHRLLSLLYFSLFVVFLFTFVIFTIQDLIVYEPSYARVEENRMLTSNYYKKININENENTKYSGWAHIDEKNEYTIIYFCGNAQTSSCFFLYTDESWKKDENYNIVVIDYPGYGKSTGMPSESSINKMSLTVYDYVSNLDNVKSDKIIVIGYSLGTGVAAYVASQRDVYKLVLVAPYTSLVDVFNSKFPVFYGPMKLIVKSKFKTIDIINKINADILIVYSLSDEIISPDLSKQLVEKGDNVESYVVDYDYHGGILSNDKVNDRIVKFINN